MIIADLPKKDLYSNKPWRDMFLFLFLVREISTNVFLPNPVLFHFLHCSL